jgi:hypothetical protein
MQLHWRVTQRDARRLRKFVLDRRRTPFVRHRLHRNVRGIRPPLNLPRFWKAVLLGLLTTQQRSGPGSPVNRLLARRPFPLTYRRVAAAKSPSSLVREVLRSHGGIRRTVTIATQVRRNLLLLQGRDWKRIRSELRRLEARHTQATERLVAEFLADHIAGLGPKQARNVLQVLGLTRYEIPLDSRVTSWLNEFGFPVRLSAQALSDPAYYSFVSDGVQALCKRAGVLPCILDAAVFSSFDAAPWTPSALL